MVCDGPPQAASMAANSAREAFVRTDRIRIVESPEERATRVRTSTIGRAVIVAGGLFLSACGGERQAALPAGPASQLVPAKARTGSWMSPAAKTASLVVYIANGQEVDAYAYKTHALLGQLLIEGANTLCSDESGNIWTSTTNRN